MKKSTMILLSLSMAFGLAACGKNQAPDSTPEAAQTVTEAAAQDVTEAVTQDVTKVAAQKASEEPQTSETAESEPAEPIEGDGKTLVVYFSRSGNTEEIAKYIAEQTGSAMYEIIPLNPYPDNYTETTEVAKAEKDNNERPEIKNPLASVEEYDRIVIGYPIWWHSAPMVIGTFLESYDLSNIDIYPFSQSASMDTEQFEQSMDFIRDCAGDAVVHEGLFAGASDTEDITAWLAENGLVK